MAAGHKGRFNRCPLEYVARTTIQQREFRFTRLPDDENYDPFLLVLREIETGKEQILPTFWAYGQSNTQRGGQFPPLLSSEEWKALFRELDADFYELQERIRIRAYELYEQRGKRDGHALEDWLQSEAELTERKSLSAVA